MMDMSHSGWGMAAGAEWSHSGRCLESHHVQTPHRALKQTKNFFLHIPLNHGRSTKIRREKKKQPSQKIKLGRRNTLLPHSWWGLQLCRMKQNRVATAQLSWGATVTERVVLQKNTNYLKKYSVFSSCTMKRMQTPHHSELYVVIFKCHLFCSHWPLFHWGMALFKNCIVLQIVQRI